MQQKITPWIIDRFDDTKILRYEVNGFDTLHLNDKLLIYYLSQAAKCGRDILFDQNFRYNLPLRRTLEAIYTTRKPDQVDEEWLAFERYLKHIWFANGVHHHYSGDKFRPSFSEEFFIRELESTPYDKLPQEFGSREALTQLITSIIFDADIYTQRITRAEGVDIVAESSCNYYNNINSDEAQEYYALKESQSTKNAPSWGLNSQLVKLDDGSIVERTYRLGGVYGDAIYNIIKWLGLARDIATGQTERVLNILIEFYLTGDLRTFDVYSIEWVKDNSSRVDFINGFIEVYGDPLGRKGAWESLVNFRCEEATKRTEIIASAAQWAEDNAPIPPIYRKAEVKGVSAKVITVAMLGGDCYPATPIGINLPNADWIRSLHGSKSVTIDNITYAYEQAAQGDGFNEEFILRPEDRQRIVRYGRLADDLHTDLHECLGHGSGRMAEGITGSELRNYGSIIEEARADLFALYYLADEKLTELGLTPDGELYKAHYAKYMVNGAMTQLARVELGCSVEQTHMRNRKLITEWCLERSRNSKVVEKIIVDNKNYIVVNDFVALRELFAELLYEVQRIKSEGDFEAARNLVEQHGIIVDRTLHAEVLERYAKLNIEPYNGFVNPEYRLIEKDGVVVDVAIEYTSNYTEQMLSYSQKYSFLPNVN